MIEDYETEKEEKANRQNAQEQRHKEAEQSKWHKEADQLVKQFLAIMRRGGNPGIQADPATLRKPDNTVERRSILVGVLCVVTVVLVIITIARATHHNQTQDFPAILLVLPASCAGLVYWLMGAVKKLFRAIQDRNSSPRPIIEGSRWIVADPQVSLTIYEDGTWKTSLSTLQEQTVVQIALLLRKLLKDNGLKAPK